LTAESLRGVQASCQLEDCLADYTRLELLTDCICRKCSLLATHCRLIAEAERLAEAIKGDPNASVSKKKRAREARRLEGRVKAALEEGRIEDDLKGVKIEKVFSKASTKQAMIARVNFFFITHFFELTFLVKATSRPRTAHKPFSPLWCLRI
jgi:ubiquitin carboxyl-terminal hydrolase 1